MLRTTVQNNAAAGEQLELTLFDAQLNYVGQAVQGVTGPSTEVLLPVTKPRKWSAEDPYLYTLVLSLGTHVISHKIGFKRVEMKGGNLLVNGAPIIFQGVNRHEHHPLFGRAVPGDFMERDIRLMKLHNVNAIRTSHQINDPRLYDLADQYGL